MGGQNTLKRHFFQKWDFKFNPPPILFEIITLHHFFQKNSLCLFTLFYGQFVYFLKRLKKSQIQEKLSESEVKQTSSTTQAETTIEDGLYATVGYKAITKSDIINQIKVILISNNKSYSEHTK